jgi:hypothetical protein
MYMVMPLTERERRVMYRKIYYVHAGVCLGPCDVRSMEFSGSNFSAEMQVKSL